MSGTPHTIHKFKRKNLTRDKSKPKYLVFTCTLPNCSYYIRLDLANNKECICNRCEKPFLMNSRSMAEAKPHCNECVRKKGVTVKKDHALDEFLNELGLK